MANKHVLTLELPDFASMTDDEVQAHVLARHRDGRWSRQTRWLLDRFQTDKLELNEAWAETWTDWKCPACKRQKIDIARMTEHGVLLCQLDDHHDHLDDKAKSLMREQLPADLPDDVRGIRMRAITAARPLIERFAETLLCNDCNAADGAMKIQLGNLVPAWFSFRPSEIARFILPEANKSHAIDVRLGTKIWEEVRDDFAERCAFAEMLGARIGAGQHDRECGLFAQRHTHEAALFYTLGSSAATARNRLEGLGAGLLARSRSTAGRWSAGKDRSRRKVQVPSAEEFAKKDTEQVAKSRWWRESGSQWRCPCCSRSKFEIMRRSNKGGWHAAIMVATEFEVETDPAALWRRAFHQDGPIVFGSSRQIGVCQDCRKILSDTVTIRPGVGADCLSLAQIRALVAPAMPHSLHAVTPEEIGAIVDANASWIAAVSDFRCHQRQTNDIHFEHYKMMRNTGLSAQGAREVVIPKLVRENQLPAADAADWFDWWMSEHERLQQNDKRET